MNPCPLWAVSEVQLIRACACPLLVACAVVKNLLQANSITCSRLPLTGCTLCTITTQFLRRIGIWNACCGWTPFATSVCPTHLQVEGIDMIFVDASMGIAATEVEAIEKAAKSSKKLLDCKALSCSARKASTSDVCLIGKPQILWPSTLFLDSSRFGGCSKSCTQMVETDVLQFCQLKLGNYESEMSWHTQQYLVF